MPFITVNAISAGDENETHCSGRRVCLKRAWYRIGLGQPAVREALQKKVEADGWKVTRIKTDDGCYEVHATNEQGQRYEGKFDPGTLNALKVEIKYK